MERRLEELIAGREELERELLRQLDPKVRAKLQREIDRIHAKIESGNY